MYEAPGSCGLIVGQLRQRDPGAGLPLGRGGMSIGIRPITVGSSRSVGGQPQDDVVELLPLDHLRERPAADGDLDHRLHVGHVDPVSGARPAVDLDLQVGLADDVEQPDVLDPRDRPQDVDDPLADLLQLLQVVAEELDRVGPLDAREGLLDVVADELREVEVDPRELAGTSPSARPGSSRGSSPGCATPPSACRGALNSMLKKLVTSVPSSGRPTCDITPRISGTEAITSRSRGAIREAASSETVRGRIARIQRFPSSSCGMNSPPRRRDQRRREGEQAAHEASVSHAVAEHPVQGTQVAPLHQPVDDRVLLLGLVLEQERAEHRRQRHGDQSGPRRSRTHRCWPSGRRAPPRDRSWRTGG